jgi:murein tripeptide amidase MpaA
MGQTTQGRDMNYLTLDLEGQSKQKPAILMTGATHARELISTSLNVYEMLKLIKKGLVDKEPKYQQLLQQNKYYFLPILNVDGVALIEQGWEDHHKIDPKRKNMDS